MFNTPDSFVWNKGLSSSFPDPFCDMASQAMPRDMASANKFCEYTCSANGPYRSALERIVSYFLTDIEIVAARQKDEEVQLGDAEKAQYLTFFNEELKIKSLLKSVAMDFLVYGNSFTSIVTPFQRYIRCQTEGCGHETPVREFMTNRSYSGRWEQFEFRGTCPICKETGKWDRKDRKLTDPKQVRVKRWSPHELEIFHCPYSMRKLYEWVIPAKVTAAAKQGNVFHLETIPWEVMESVRKGGRVRFNDDVLFHMLEQPLAGIDTAGWGLSRVLVNFRQAYLYQILNRQNEGIAMDYIIPLRTITPAAKSGATPESTDPLMTINMGDFMGHVRRMLKIRRFDPTAIQTLPYPIEYAVHGGEGQQLAPTELIAQALQQLLDSIGVPVELYKGSLTLQTAPASLRLFEATWSQLVDELNSFLHQLAVKLAKLFDWGDFSCRLVRVTHADDLNRQMAKLQLAQAGKISDTTGLAAVGLSFPEEMQKKVDDQKLLAKLEGRAQEELEQQDALKQMGTPQQAVGPDGQPVDPAQGGQPAQPGDPAGAPVSGGMAQQFSMAAPPVPGKPISLEELQSQAETLAQQIAGMPEAQKDSTLIELKKQNPVLHAITKSVFDSIKRQAALQGRDMVMQQQFGQTQGQPQGQPV